MATEFELLFRHPQAPRAPPAWALQKKSPAVAGGALLGSNSRILYLAGAVESLEADFECLLLLLLLWCLCELDFAGA
jgi:hypothetical protein